MNPTGPRSNYRVYVLRSWREALPSSEAPGSWRFSLEDPTTRQRRGFADLESLMSYLAAQTDRTCPAESGNIKE